MTTTGKTPVSLLNEMLVRKNLQPMYTLLMSGVGTNQGTFLYEVTAGNFIKARGKGRSKKEAKQDAAKEALKNMQSNSDTRDTSFEEETLQIPNMDVISPYQAQMKENAVGSLNELCVSSQMPQPVYHLIREDGPPHAKQFELACRVSSFEHSGVGRTKQQAKQLAAKSMLETLEKLEISEREKSTIVEDMPSQTPEEREKLMASIHAARNSHGLNTLPSRHLLGQQMGKGLKHDWPQEKLAKIKEIRTSNTDALVQMKQICQQLDLEMTFTDIPSNHPEYKLSILNLSTHPENCFLGCEATRDGARANAAAIALSFIDIMV